MEKSFPRREFSKFLLNAGNDLKFFDDKLPITLVLPKSLKEEAVISPPNGKANRCVYYSSLNLVFILNPPLDSYFLFVDHNSENKTSVKYRGNNLENNILHSMEGSYLEFMTQRITISFSMLLFYLSEEDGLKKLHYEIIDFRRVSKGQISEFRQFIDYQKRQRIKKERELIRGKEREIERVKKEIIGSYQLILSLSEQSAEIDGSREGIENLKKLRFSESFEMEEDEEEQEEPDEFRSCREQNSRISLKFFLKGEEITDGIWEKGKEIAMEIANNRGGKVRLVGLYVINSSISSYLKREVTVEAGMRMSMTVGCHENDLKKPQVDLFVFHLLTEKDEDIFFLRPFSLQ